ncbi:MAG: hypothetical protein Kow006_07380 [Gammaproteobacteria bacterium]
MRGLYMLLFALFYSLGELVLVAVVLFQFVSRLFTGEVNERLLQFGGQLSRYLYDALRFFTFNSEDKPYPFSPWPSDGAPASSMETSPAAAKKKSATKKRSTSKKKSTPKKSSPNGETSSADQGGD